MLGGHRVIAFDGKTLKGARDAAGNLAHLLAALCQRTGVVLAQVGVTTKPMKSLACKLCWLPSTQSRSAVRAQVEVGDSGSRMCVVSLNL